MIAQLIPPGFLKAWAAAAAVILIIDAIWLGAVAKNFYRDQLGGLMADKIKLPVAALFYIFYSGAAVLLASAPAVRLDAGIWTAVLLGAVLGFAAYGAYDFTNLATIRDWPVMLTIVDLVWGTVLTATVSAAGFAVLRMGLSPA